MPPRSAGPATPPSDAGSPQTTTAAAVRGPQQEMQTGTRRSGSEPRTDQSQEFPPALGWRSSASDHVLRDRRLGDLEPKLQEFTMDARRSPQRVLRVHFSDELATRDL